MQGFSADGYFQEYAVVEARGAMVLPEGIDLVEAGLLLPSRPFDIFLTLT